MKQQLRKKYLQQRDELPSDYRKQAATTIFSKIESLPLFKNAKSIFIYVGFGSEILTEDFIKKHLSTKEIYTPKIVNSEMHLVKITSWNDLKEGHFGVLEAESNDFYTGKIDLVITPSITYSKNGYRLGYGRGYYDKYFAKNKYNTAVGVAYEKLIKEVPIESHDKKVDLLITEEGTYITNEKYNSIN